MAKVGDSVRKSIDDWTLGQLDFAMLHACNAVDGTAKKAYPAISGNAQRFTRLLRDNYAVLGPMSMPGINIMSTRWPVKIKRPSAPGGGADLADVVYGIHRCTHGHGDELPDGFELIPNAAGPSNYTRLEAQRGKVRLSDRIIFGLLAVAVMSPANVGQSVPAGYHLSFGAHVMPINEWWGRAKDFPALASNKAMPNVTLNFDNWMNTE
jgi:hypothetical protein